jgi:phage terminase small subunit
MGKLTAKQEMFCKEYLIDLNATQAAIRAGYSVNAARQQGAENMAKPVILERVQDLMAKRSKKVGVDAEWVIKGIESLTDELRYSEAPKDAYKGYELMGRHLKLFTDNVDLNATVAITRIERKIV